MKPQMTVPTDDIGRDVEALIACATALLNKIDSITTDEFEMGGERPEREALRECLKRF